MSFYKLELEVSSKNLCCNCGACALVCPQKVIYMEQTATALEPRLNGKCLGEKCSMCVAVCPGYRIPRSEIEKHISGRVRDNSGIERTQGVLHKVYISQWNDESILQRAGSGGVTTGLLSYALEKGLIDGALVVGQSKDRPWLSQPVIATTRQELIDTAGTRYDALPQLTGLREAADRGLSKIAVVGMPCQITALRKMQLQGRKYSKVTSRIKYMFGLWCMGSWARNGIEFLVERQLGIPLSEVTSLRWRARPFPGQLTIRTKSGKETSHPLLDRWVASRMATAFLPDSCLQCTDAQAEFADLSFGDPWGHPIDQEALKSGIGFTCALVRNQNGDDLMLSAKKDGMFRYFKEVTGEERNFLERTSAVVSKHWGHQGFIDSRKRHGLPARIID